MKEVKLDKYEKDILEAYDRGELKPVNNMNKRISALRTAAKNTLKKDQRVNIRLSSKDLTEIQVAAIKEGMPYQTLMASILHKYVRRYFNKSKHSTAS
jgi:predicted DNA binding CopG/RHH family protein